MIKRSLTHYLSLLILQLCSIQHAGQRIEMNGPWAEGPKELMQHAIDHLSEGNDFDRRIAMISIDNAVELMIKTFLSLPKRARGTDGPTRKELENSFNSFPALLDLIEMYAEDKLSGVSLEEIEWYHRLRNQLYHSGNGITVELSKVETYLSLAKVLYQNLFESSLDIKPSSPIEKKLGAFLGKWGMFDKEFRKQLPPKDGPALYWKRNYLETISPEAAELWMELNQFRNYAVHMLEDVKEKEFDEAMPKLDKLIQYIEKTA
jgi:hypothetical protein